MLSKADNEFLTLTGKDTPMGSLLRRFWMPALLSEELPERDGPPKKIRLMGEDLLAFRDSNGRSAAPPSTTAAARRAACVVPFTAGSSTSTATASTCRPHRPSHPTRTRSG